MSDPHSFVITSASNPRLKLVRQLQRDRNTRESEQLFVVEGAKLVDDLLNCGLRAEFVLLTDDTTDWQRTHPNTLCLRVSASLMREVSSEVTPPGVLAVFKMPSDIAFATQTPAPILILDQLRDPGNMGACLRVAAGAGCREVLLAPGCVDAYNPKVVRGGMGAHGRLAIRSVSWAQIRQICRNRPIYGTSVVNSLPYDSVAWREPCAIIIGSEAEGMSDDAQHLMTQAIHIPMLNQVESLNAAVACGIILFEVARQNRVCG
ncbi:MAG: RNA methyltransferase [Anaerolineae bacterium]|nr:RNA methyltransferase [Anaerolineae bacterium]